MRKVNKRNFPYFFPFVSSFSPTIPILYSYDINSFIGWTFYHDRSWTLSFYLTQSHFAKRRKLKKHAHLYLNILYSSTSKLFAIELNLKKMETIPTCIQTHIHTTLRKRKNIKVENFLLWCEWNTNESFFLFLFPKAGMNIKNAWFIKLIKFMFLSIKKSFH